MPGSLDALRALVIDADGVLWRGKQPLPGVPAFFDFLKTHAIKFMIATNNSAHPPTSVTERLQRMGARVSVENVLTSALATAMCLPRLAPNAKRVLVIGGEGLTMALTDAGYHIVDENADAVVVGIDIALTYEKLTRAMREIQRGAVFIGTNADATYPAADGLIPGAGTILAAIQTASGVAPIVIGKPERTMFDLAVEKMGVAREATATLGDRLETDIEGGMRAGLKSILVMTGITTPEILAQSSLQPDFVFDDLNALRAEWARGY